MQNLCKSDWLLSSVRHREEGLKHHAEEHTLNYILAVAGKYSELFPPLNCALAHLTAPEHTHTQTHKKQLVLHMLAIISPGLAIVLISVTIVFALLQS